jgi:hypothetical protein
MKFWRDCQGSGIAAEPMPVPRALSASCGTCVRFEAKPQGFAAEPYDLEGLYAILDEGGYRALEP